MLFDLKGKRRRTVQVVYLALAILMGAGLVLFGIGSSTNGGLGDLFNGGNGKNTANASIQKKITAAELTLRRDPKNQAALIAVIKGHYQLATSSADPNTPFWKGAADAADVLSTEKPTAQSFIVLVQYASLAGETRKADLAGKQAIKVAPKSQKKAAKQAVAQAKAAAAQQSAGSSGATTTPAPAP
jgi:hypothetical protein